MKFFYFCHEIVPGNNFGPYVQFVFPYYIIDAYIITFEGCFYNDP